MGTQETSGYCSHCDKNVLCRAQTPNHILHLILSIVTSGVWLIIWAILCIRAKEWHCSQCGHKITKSFGDETGSVGSHVKKIRECPYCGAKNRGDDISCLRCSKPI